MNASPPRPCKILVIDDERGIRVALRMTFAPIACTFFEASTGEQGLVLAREEQPDVIILDLGLPDVDGIEVCRRLREDEQTREAMIVILSARSLPEDRAEALAVGADEYWTKPFRPGELRAHVGAKIQAS